MIAKLTLLLCFLGFTNLGKAQARQETSFDDHWRFLNQDVKGAENVSFDDSKWRILNVPHDWSIEGQYDQANTTGRGGGYLPSGIGWYRKVFTLGENVSMNEHYITFDGVMKNSDVWINGVHLGHRPYGYSSFTYDLTKYLKFGKKQVNVIAVRADNSVQPASRYYTGAGIYRHVRVISVNPLHFVPLGTFVSTQAINKNKATINLKSVLVNHSQKAGNYTVEITIQNAGGEEVKRVSVKHRIGSGARIDLDQDIMVISPKLWDVDHPNMYKAVVKLWSGAILLDDQSVPFGIRTGKFEAATGFWLNGKNIKIKGVCLHHDGGAVGAAVPLAIWEERFKLLKAVGVNAIRTSHNPVAPEFLDLCDQKGFLVMDETFDTWTAAKNNGEKGYNLYFKDWWRTDTRDMVIRDRNHPSIIIYSIGNEIHDDLSYPNGFKIYKAQEDEVKAADPTRPVTMALFRPGISKVYGNGFAAHMDIVGQNYRENELIAAHEAHPEWKVIGTENTHVLAQWLALRDKPYMAGQFLWTGFDYLGESDWPQTTNDQGLFDRAGNWKQQALQRQSWWSDKAVVHIVRKSDNAGSGTWVADWTPTDFDTYDNAKVEVYSNCEEIELFVNGKSLGTKSKPANDSPRDWDVTFEKGVIKAIGKNKGKEVASEEYKTAGIPAKIILSSSSSQLKNNWDGASIITATIVDRDGTVCPNADNQIKFSISGPGMIQATDNGNVNSHEPYASDQHKAYRGKAIAIVKANGTSGSFSVKATSGRISSASTVIAIQGN